MSDSSLQIINNDTKRRSHSNTISGGRPPALDIDVTRPTPTRRNSEGSPHLPPIYVSEPTPVEPSVDNEFFSKPVEPSVDNEFFSKPVPTPADSRPSTPASDTSNSPPPPNPVPKYSATAPVDGLLDSSKVKKNNTRPRGSSITSNLINEIKENATIQNLANKIKSRQSEDAEERNSVDGTVSSVATNNVYFANAKRNQDFHALFRSVPEEDSLIEDFGCALQKEILLQGRIYISENHLCFNANIFGWVTNLVIAFADITDIEKKATAYFIPNAIQISTDTGKHFFASFLSRDQAHDLIVDIWKNARPDLATKDTVQPAESVYSEGETDSFYDSDTEDSYSDSSSNHSGFTSKGTRSVSSNTDTRDRQVSPASLPAVKDEKVTDNRRRAVSELPKPKLDDMNKCADDLVGKSAPADPTTESTRQDKPTEKAQVNEISECECTDHYPTTVMEQVYGGSVEGMYNLLFNNDFMKKFLIENQKLTELNMGEWKKAEGMIVETRDLSYIKPLNGAIGPKSAKCLITEEVLHKDFDRFVTVLTTTSTPEVPSGGSFTCKTKTCITWAGKGKVKLLVTVLVDFTKTSWFKSAIEKASIEGQQTYYKDLDVALRSYFKEFDQVGRPESRKKRKGKRSKRPRSITKSEPKSVPAEKKDLLAIVSDAAKGLFNVIRSPNSSHLTLLCLLSMVFINIFIAKKMSYVEQQLIRLRQPTEEITPENYVKQFSRDYNRQEEQDLWDWLGRIDPEKSQVKEKITVPTHANYDDAIMASKVAKERLDKHMMELSNMIQMAESNLEQVTKSVSEQRQKIKEE
ncbi:hypothetical protein HPULCUR_003058 [Helicostylum pulchrum]|uniref:VASt domain-containing protein n=1 Tax=Helicostylum pulchrum TaxID=562976 RepID=A0ABP9XSC8_9FUNG